MTKIAILVGSLRSESVNKKLAKAIEELAPTEVEFINLDISEVPLFSEDLEDNVPASVQKLKADIEAADGVLFVTPEYNRGIPGVMKNAIDWASRPYGSNSFEHKPVGLVGASMSLWGTVAAQQHLKSILVYLNTHVMGSPEVYSGVFNPLFDETGELQGDWKERLTKYGSLLNEHVVKFK